MRVPTPQLRQICSDGNERVRKRAAGGSTELSEKCAHCPFLLTTDAKPPLIVSLPLAGS